MNSDCTGTLTADAFESGKLVRTSVFSIVSVKKLREALGDDAENPRFIETLSKRL